MTSSTVYAETVRRLCPNSILSNATLSYQHASSTSTSFSSLDDQHNSSLDDQDKVWDTVDQFNQCLENKLNKVLYQQHNGRQHNGQQHNNVKGNSDNNDSSKKNKKKNKKSNNDPSPQPSQTQLHEITLASLTFNPNTHKTFPLNSTNNTILLHSYFNDTIQLHPTPVMR
eukprot:CAMPEP_0118641008 /NCGR_PEP_ID=MMETSP0785-20121206/5049_1 /TAXON_ID=91992 /ORGANISM="Bolidomonas pacifica, Strain CCMP 1866" /LENGTH=169 /DNA_ID=CAMNT_0006532417 /DNA_START=195 /DNA_END=704 /DNA_ORIENTATION=-